MLADEDAFVGLTGLNRALLGRGENNGSNLLDSAGKGFHRNPVARRARAKRQQRAVRVYLLSPAAAQQRRQLSASRGAARLCTQRRGSGRTLAARERAAAGGGKEVTFRADAAFAKPEIVEVLEETMPFGYRSTTIWNEVLPKCCHAR
jgi:hypothetical protein